jgi:hypothetical protein
MGLLWLLSRRPSSTDHRSLGGVDVMTALPRSPAVESADADTALRDQTGAARLTPHQRRTGRLLPVADEVDAANAEQLLDQVGHDMCGKWFLVDMIKGESAMPRACGPGTQSTPSAHVFGMLWSLAAGPAGSRLVNSSGLGDDLPTSESLTAALVSVQ